MNSFERVMACAAGLPADRTPYFMLLSLFASQWMGADLKTYYHSPELLVAAQETIVERLGVDIVMTQFSVGLEAEAFGATLRWYKNQPPNIITRRVQNFNDLKSFRMPDINEHPNLLHIRETVRRLRSRLGKEFPVVVPVMGPFELAIAMMGMDLTMDMVLYHPETSAEILAQTGRFFVDWCNTLLADGAHIPLMSSAFGNATVLTAQMLRSFVLPELTLLLPRIKAPIVFHHGGGRLQNVLADLKTLPNIIGFYVDAQDDLMACRDIIGNLLLLGNLSGPSMPSFSAIDIRKSCTEKLTQMKPGGRFILATSGADIPLDTPIDRLYAISEAVQEFAESGEAV